MLEVNLAAGRRVGCSEGGSLLLTSVASPHPPVLCCAGQNERHVNKKGKRDRMSMRDHPRRTQKEEVDVGATPRVAGAGERIARYS